MSTKESHIKLTITRMELPAILKDFSYSHDSIKELTLYWVSYGLIW